MDLVSLSQPDKRLKEIRSIILRQNKKGLGGGGGGGGGDVLFVTQASSD